MSTELSTCKFGAAYQGGESLYIFPVPQDWDGYRFAGYFTSSEPEVVAYFGSAANAAYAWVAKHGLSDEEIRWLLDATKRMDGVPCPGTLAVERAAKLQALGYDIRWRLDGPPLVYKDGATV